MTPKTSQQLYEPMVNVARLRHALSNSEEGVLDGRRVSRALREGLAEQVETLRARGVEPTLALLRVGDDPASAVYVGAKERACAGLGVRSLHEHLPSRLAAADLLARIDALNERSDVHGVLVQLPLPAHIREWDVIERVHPHKDVDGFHPLNLGRLIAGRGVLEACTPRGVMTLLQAAGVDLVGLQAVVVGRSKIVGRPMAQMLMRANATVTVCHRSTRDLEAAVRQADLVVVATGVPGLVRGSWIAPGAVVVDVGISRMPDGSLRGDVEYEIARQRARWITPVPGGVGPMTVATLMENTLRAAWLQTLARERA